MFLCLAVSFVAGDYYIVKSALNDKQVLQLMDDFEIGVLRRLMEQFDENKS